ncbi:hypothetical protein EDD15DRAFT_2279744 [Pisolithus albus]|nr:hypothetical protein EDD15DRAFT_2279744 [Pisolithus albus]
MDGDIASATLPRPTFGGLHPPAAAGVENCADPTQCGDVGLPAGSTQTCSQYELVTGITAETDQRRCVDYSLLRQICSGLNCFPRGPWLVARASSLREFVEQFSLHLTKADMAEMAHRHGVFLLQRLSHYRRRDVLCLHESSPPMKDLSLQ